VETFVRSAAGAERTKHGRCTVLGFQQIEIFGLVENPVCSMEQAGKTGR